MDFLSLKSLLVLSRTLNFRQAAEHLNMTQPALSLRLKRLEDELGFRLFDRNRVHVALSAEGHRFLPHVELLLAQAERTRVQAQRIAQGESGHLGIGFTPVSFFAYVPELIQKFSALNPEIDLTLSEHVSGAVETALTQHDIDVGFLHPPVVATDLDLVALQGETFSVALSTANPLSGKQRLSLADLAQEDFILPRRSIGPALYDRIVALCQAAGFSPRIRQEVTSSVAVLGLVAAGHGTGLVIEAMANMTRPGLCFRPLEGPKPHLPFALATRRDDTSRVVTRFRDYIQAQAGT
ncbi:MAG: LysR substrate-binding domain-containing protein [Pseudomonadota bacterium]